MNREVEAFRAALRESLGRLGVHFAGRENDLRRWTAADLVADLAPLLCEELRYARAWPSLDLSDGYKVHVRVQMPCGCPVGSHPPGPCEATGFGWHENVNDAC